MFVVPEPCTPQILALLESLDKSYRTLKIPSVQELLKPRCKPFIYDVSFDDGRHAPLTVMHTSGSTGLPKPITWPQDFVSASAKQFQLDPPAGYESTDHLYKGNRVFVAFPPFHVSKSYICSILTHERIFFGSSEAEWSNYLPLQIPQETSVGHNLRSKSNICYSMNDLACFTDSVVLAKKKIRPRMLRTSSSMR